MTPLLVFRCIAIEATALPRPIQFHVVSPNENPDLIFEFNIGSIRFDPIGGWIADQAILRIRDAKSQETVCIYQAKTIFITPSVDNLIYKIIKKLKKQL